MNYPIYYSKCKNKTSNFNSIITQTSNKRWSVSAQCLKCKTNKDQSIQKPQDRLLLAKELHKPVRTHFRKRSILTKGTDDLWTADLTDMKKYSEENEEYVYLLNAIDTSSKFAWALPIKKKDGVSISKAFEKIIKSASSQNNKPSNFLHTDKRLEFENKYFKGILNNFNIKLYHTQNLEKSAIIERFNRTLNNKMKIQFEARNNKKWIDILQNLLDKYNFKDKHRPIGMTPSEVNKSNENLVLRTLFKQSKKESKIKLKVGDRVRITGFKYTLSNKYDPNWTREFFLIKEILNTQPVTYKIKDLMMMMKSQEHFIVKSYKRQYIDLKNNNFKIKEMFKTKEIFDKYAEEITRFQYKNFNPTSTLNLNEANKKTTLKRYFEDDFISKNILYYIAGKISPVDSTKSYNNKSNIRMIDNFVAHLFNQIEVRKHGILIDEIEFTGITSTIKGCVAYSGLNEYNGEAFNSGFKVPIHEGQNFEALGKLGDL